jgi:signal transduction histidine kinase
MENGLITYWDLPERKPIGDVLISREIVKSNYLVNQILEGFPEAVLLLNQERQIVVCNFAALRIFNVTSEEEILGKRIGEAFHCIHSNDLEGGCGTSKFCKECGAGRALKRTREDSISVEEECRIIAERSGGHQFFNVAVKTKPLIIEEKDFTLVSIVDISAKKRRNELERIFFHDILNTGSAINGLAELLVDEEDELVKTELIDSIISSSRQLINEILHQRELSSAQDGNLEVTLSETSVNTILKIAFELYEKHKLAEDKNLAVDYLKEDVKFITDQTLLVRSIGNLIKNALEASRNNELIRIYSNADDLYITFFVYNEGIIPDQVKLNIFQRSFSTKASKGRGIGTYSVKLLVEDYLKGEVGFVSDDINKTIFHIKINKVTVN